MKKILLTAILLLSISFAFADDFCNGFKAGYKAGYCYNQQFGCVIPFTPPCPAIRPALRLTYEGGYAEGFVAGRNTSDIRTTTQRNKIMLWGSSAMLFILVGGAISSRCDSGHGIYPF
jgi:hypothetical protein